MKGNSKNQGVAAESWWSVQTSVTQVLNPPWMQAVWAVPVRPLTAPSGCYYDTN